MMMHNQKIWDVAVIGGGPAGMMAAGRAAELGASVILIEKNDTLGKKLMLTGGGRCNLTNYELNTRKFLENFKKDSRFLFSAFSQHGVSETLNFFHKQGLETKIEEEGRVFPTSNKADSVFKILMEYMKEGGAKTQLGNPVKKIISKKNIIEAVELENGEKIYAHSFVLATGGKSHPETGSTGDGFPWLETLGHKIIKPNSSLVPIAIKDDWVKTLSGTTLSDIKIAVFQNNKKQITKKGRILFTHFGVSGPMIINMSKDIGNLLKSGSVVISLDLFPSLGHGDLDIKIQAAIRNQSNKKIRNIINAFVPIKALESIITKLAGINSEDFCHNLTREKRLSLVNLLKGIPMRVDRLLGTDKAIITSGGVSPTEVDFKTMRSRLISNLYLVGDVLDIDRPSGGYSLQLCWTTGYIAGTRAFNN